MVHSHRKAMKTSAIMAAILAIPLSFTIYVKGEYKKSLEDQVYASVGLFYFESEDGQAFSQVSLKNKVSLLALVPENCSSCAPETFQQVAAWAGEHLSYQGIKKVPFQLLTLGPAPGNLSGEWVRLRAVDGSGLSEQVRPFLGERTFDKRMAFVLVDEEGQVRGIFDEEPASWDSMTRLWSQVTFNHYLFDYLSKRTFFGPKKESRYSLH